jgi:coenzyme F420-reducing hydrogenase alpha subunit
MVAPTEWNFHACGPLVGQLTGARLGSAEAARAAAETLARLIDPCCAFETAVREE